MENPSDGIRERLDALRARIDRVAERAGRDPSDVTLVAVSKTFSSDVVKAAIEAGAGDLGENRAQELKEKAATLGHAARWHFVGPLQTNKVRTVVGIAHLIHSVDRHELAEVISKRAVSAGVVQDVLIEINLSGEATKHGVSPSEALGLLRAVHGLDNITVKGLMTMAPFSEDPETSRPYFRQLARLRGEAVAVVSGADDLSMGMSRDFEVAVEEGATLVRVGEAIFGSRRH